MLKIYNMGLAEINAAKVDLVRYILNEADSNIIEQLIEDNMETSEKPKNLYKHLGKLKRGIDGLKYQKSIRDEWD